MSEKRLSLLELNSLVRELIEMEMPNEYWVEAELSECRESRGHCYMELIQRDERSATPSPGPQPSAGPRSGCSSGLILNALPASSYGPA